MKKYKILIIIFIPIVLLSCNNIFGNPVEEIKQYIKKNKLPITINEEIIINDDFNITDKTNFQIFILNIFDTLADNISEGNFNDETINNYIIIEKIVSGYYESCVNNNYELAIIFNNTKNENKFLIDYLEQNNYNVTFHNNFAVFDNNTDFAKLEILIGELTIMGDMARNNLTGYFQNESSYEDFDIVLEVIKMNICYNMIGDLIYLIKIKGYNYNDYENIKEETKNKILDFWQIMDGYNKNR